MAPGFGYGVAFSRLVQEGKVEING